MVVDPSADQCRGPHLTVIIDRFRVVVHVDTNRAIPLLCQGGSDTEGSDLIGLGDITWDIPPIESILFELLNTREGVPGGVSRHQGILAEDLLDRFEKVHFDLCVTLPDQFVEEIDRSQPFAFMSHLAISHERNITE